MFTSPAKKFSHQGRFSGGVIALIHKSLASYIKRLDTEIGNAIYLFLNGSGTLWDSQTGSNGLRLPSSNAVAIS